MYWVVMRRMGRSDGSFLTGHMWLIRIRPHKAPDTPTKITAPLVLFMSSVFYWAPHRGRRCEKRRRYKRTKVLIWSEPIWQVWGIWQEVQTAVIESVFPRWSVPEQDFEEAYGWRGSCSAAVSLCATGGIITMNLPLQVKIHRKCFGLQKINLHRWRMQECEEIRLESFNQPSHLSVKLVQTQTTKEAVLHSLTKTSWFNWNLLVGNASTDVFWRAVKKLKPPPSPCFSQTQSSVKLTFNPSFFFLFFMSKIFFFLHHFTLFSSHNRRLMSKCAAERLDDSSRTDSWVHIRKSLVCH